MNSHWLYKASTRRKLWIGGIVMLVLTAVGELFLKLHPYFEIAEVFSFHAVYGFLSCIVMIIFSWLLGFFIKRKDDYYDE